MSKTADSDSTTSIRIQSNTMHVSFILTLCFTSITSAVMPNCDDITPVTVKLCASFDNYSSIEYPEPFPVFVNSSFVINDIQDIDENLQIINLLLTLNTNWSDDRIQVVVNDKIVHYSYPWIKLNSQEIESIWKPSLQFSNSISTHLANDVPSDIWYYHGTPSIFWWTRTFSLSLTCEMEFIMFPFDSHNCSLKLVNVDGASFSSMQDSRVFFMNQDTNSEKLKFDVEIHPKNTHLVALKPEFPTSMYSEARIEMILYRKRREFFRLFSEFYLPTFAFSKMALFAYSIPIESVPGRMGLLITAYLITTNIYVNTEAPSTRGFSYMDIWMTGAIAPIQIGIIQYGILLTILRFGYGSICGYKINFDRVDRISSIFTMLLALLFDVSYFILCFQ